MGPRSDVGKVLAMAVLLAVVLGWIAFPKGGGKIKWDSGLPAAPVETKTKPKGFEEQVLKMRFGIGKNGNHTLEEVGQDFDVTRERIRQIEAKALRKLQKLYYLGQGGAPVDFF